MRLTNPVRAFTEEAFVEDSDEAPITMADAVTKPALYVGYEHFCKKHKLAVMSEMNFGKIMKKELGYPDGRETTADRHYIWKGVRLTEEYLVVLAQGMQATLK